MSDSHTSGTLEGWGPPVQVSSQAWRPSSLNTISLYVNRVPSTKAGNSLRASAWWVYCTCC